jgi:hypothetical protein
MTKVQTTFKLSRPLEDKDLENISRMNSVYGMFATRLQSSGEELFVEYDASRLSLNEVRGTLEQHGLPLK